tara:strand:+ start:9165 stop:10031 length:867 start_codon:yes stop_codon:yes gene_type:complete
MIEQYSITIIGRGALGSALFDFFNEKSYLIRSVWNKKQVEIRTKVEGSVDVLDKHLPTEEREMGDLIFLAVPDDQIELLSDELSRIPIQWEKRFIIHCSGNLSSDACSSLKKCGAKVAAMHPIQTFNRGDGMQRFRDIYVTLEGDDALISILILIVKQMGAKPLKITAEQKRVIHVAAVIASNYMVSLLHVSESLLNDAGISESLDIIQPLVFQTVQNIFEKGVKESLTGPISRGDIQSVKYHLELLGKDKHTREIYKLLGSEALVIAQKNQNLDEKIINQFLALFSQ